MAGRPRWRALAADDRGISSVEIALVIGLLVMIVTATLDFGRALAARNEMSHALGRAARLTPDSAERAKLESLILTLRALTGIKTAVADATLLTRALELDPENRRAQALLEQVRDRRLATAASREDSIRITARFEAGDPSTTV